MKTYYEGFSNAAGVYKIINIQNGRIYIGSAKEFKRRCKDHIKQLRINRHSNKFLQHDFNKCGEDAFEFRVIEVVPNSTKEQRFEVEQKYLNEVFDKQEHCYNINPNTTQLERSVFSKNPEATKEKLRQKSKALWQDPVYVEKRVASLRKLNENPEYRKKLSVAQQKSWDENKEARTTKSSMTMKQKFIDNPEFAAKSKANLIPNKAKPDEEYSLKPALITPDGEVLDNIRNAKKFARDHDLDTSGIYKVLKGQLKSYKGYSLF